MANLTDDMHRVVREVWRLNLRLGFGDRIGLEMGPGFTHDDVRGRLAKAAGATRAQVEAWLGGTVQPSTSQALAVLDALPLPVSGPVVAALNGEAAH